MPLDIAGSQRLARPVDAYYRGRALRQAERIAAQEEQLNELAIQEATAPKQPAQPKPEDMLKIQEFVIGRQEQTLKGYEALKDCLWEKGIRDVTIKDLKQAMKELSKQGLVELKPSYDIDFTLSGRGWYACT